MPPPLMMQKEFDPLYHDPSYDTPGILVKPNARELNLEGTGCP